MASWSWIVVVVAACGSGDRDEAPVPATPRPAMPVDAAIADAPPAISAPRLDAWPHVVSTGPCRLRIEPAPASERRQRLATARGRFGTPMVEIAPLGDRVDYVDLPPRWCLRSMAPLDASDARSLARRFLEANGNLLGLTDDDLRPLFLVAHPSAGGWQVSARVTRRPGADRSPISAGAGEILVQVSGSGCLASVRVRGTLRPPLAVCAASTLEQIRLAVVGTRLEWDSEDGHKVEGRALLWNIRSVSLDLITTRPSPAGDGANEVTLIYKVVVGVGHDSLMTWTLDVNPLTREVTHAVANFFD